MGQLSEFLSGVTRRIIFQLILIFKLTSPAPSMLMSEFCTHSVACSHVGKLIRKSGWDSGSSIRISIFICDPCVQYFWTNHSTLALLLLIHSWYALRMSSYWVLVSLWSLWLYNCFSVSLLWKWVSLSPGCSRSHWHTRNLTHSKLSSFKDSLNFLMFSM